MSSMSPTPHFDKSEKNLLEHSSKSDKSDRSSQPDRTANAEKSKRPKRKEKSEKDKTEKSKSRKAKGQSPSNPTPETELDTGFDESSSRGRGSEQDVIEKQKSKGDGDSAAGNQSSTAKSDSIKSERSEIVKGEISDLDGKSRLKKHIKTSTGIDGKDSSVDSDRLAARKRRFADTAARPILQKRSRHEEEDGNHSTEFGANATYLKESDGDKHKETQRRDSRVKTDKSSTQKDSQDDTRGQREKSEASVDTADAKRHSGYPSSRRISLEGAVDQSSTRDQEQHAAVKHPNQHNETDKSAKNKEDHVDIDSSQSYRKQMEQNRRMQQQQQQREYDKPNKAESPERNETEDLEHRSLVHEVGKPPEDVTDNFPSHKLKKPDQFDADSGLKRERVYRSFRQKSEEQDWNNVSPRHQHFSQHADEELVNQTQKDLCKSDEKSNHDVDLLGKRTQNTQVNKSNVAFLGVEEDPQKRWDHRDKPDPLPDLNYSRNLSKNVQHCKRLEYGTWHDLEPGEVRSDSEEDKEPKSRSPVASTSAPFSERPRGDRFSDPKLAHLERNKFYSFALDQNITPDTKNLLERAKSLSSSREDNWSFLDYDSHFANLRNRKDTEKVDSAPRPPPSWYIKMKKKKIRSGSEDKLDDRKEESKPEEQERRELFASRFLHSPVFELDSRRLQNLVKKHEEPEQTQNSQAGQQGSMDGELETGPVVLFHSRFLELTRLQQQKNKSQQPQESKGDEASPADENKEEKPHVQEQQPVPAPETKRPVVEPEMKPFTGGEEMVVESQAMPSPVKDFPPPEEKVVAVSQAPEPDPPVTFIKEEIKEEVKETNEPLTFSPPEISDTEPALVVAPESRGAVDRCHPSPTDCKLEDVKPVVKEEPPCISQSDDYINVQPEPDLQPTQSEVPEIASVVSCSNVEDPVVVTKDTQCTSEAVVEPDVDQKAQLNNVQTFDNDTNDELVAPQKEHKIKEVKTKKGRQSPAHSSTVPPMSASSLEKQATRKSERIDKEKLKRGSSPRAESKSTAKSPTHGSDPDMLEQSISLGRAKRRNVKSVYATPVEDDAQNRSAKEAAESSRASRKRGTNKDTNTQNIEHDASAPAPAPAPTAKRGRPPKNRKQIDERSAVKVQKLKIESKEADLNESECGEQISRLSKGKISYATKGLSNPVPTAVGSETRKGEEVEADDEEMDSIDEDHLTMKVFSSSCKDQSGTFDQTKEEKDKPDKDLGKQKDAREKIFDGNSTAKGTDYSDLEDKSSSEKDKIMKGKNKSTKIPKSPVLKNLKIRLNVTEVKDLLQLGDDEPVNPEDSTSASFKLGDQVDHGTKLTGSNQSDSREKENPPLEIKKVLEISNSLIPPDSELEEAVAKLKDPDFPVQLPTPVPDTEVKGNQDEEKPTPASETELMAAIYSITPEETPVSLTQPHQLRPDAGPEPEIQDFIQPSKEEEPETNASTVEGKHVIQTTPKKGNKVRPKTPKRSKAQKQMKIEVKEEHSASEELTSSVEQNPTSAAKIVSETSPSVATTVITPATWKPESEASSPKATDLNFEEQLSEPQSQPVKAIYPQSKSPICPKPLQLLPDGISQPSPIANRTNIRPIQTSRISASPPNWHHQSKEGVIPSSYVVSLTTKETQPLTPDPEKMEPEHNTSDLRQILLKHKNVSLPSSSSVPTNQPSLQEQIPCEKNTTPTILPNRSPLSDTRMPTHPTPSIVRPPATLPSPESKSVISVIASTGTSVISRVCNPPEPEDKVNVANPCMDLPMPKTNYRPSKEDTGSYLGSSVGDEGVSGPRFIVDSPSIGVGSCSGLRVNTSEGVVVLSHSGQKTEGPQRISAKISQIPQATPGDIESQQLVAMPQIKQDMYGHSQKGSSMQTEHGHPGKPQSVLSNKQESSSLEKMESNYQSGSQGVVKRLTPGNQQVLTYHQDFMSLKHQKKMDSSDPHGTDGPKPPWSAISPAISPHLPSPPGNHVGFVATSGDRGPSHLSGAKQEPRSPRKSGHTHSQFTKVSSPIGSSSPKGIPVMLPTGHPAMQQFITGVHHAEQSVIMPPHSVPSALGRMSPHCVTQSIPVAHLVQGDVRVNTPPLSVMNYGMHSEPLAWSGAMQPRPTSPQAVGRDKVLKVNPGSLRSHEGEQEEARHFHLAGRQSATQIKTESVQSDPCGPFYMAQRDMRVLLHQQGERSATDSHPAHISEALPPMSPRPHVLTKGVSEKDLMKPLDPKRPHSPLPKDGILGIRQAGQAMASPQRVQLMQSGPSGSFAEYSGMYTNPRGIHNQISDASVVGTNQPQLNITPSMVSRLALWYQVISR